MAKKKKAKKLEKKAKKQEKKAARKATKAEKLAAKLAAKVAKDPAKAEKLAAKLAAQAEKAAARAAAQLEKDADKAAARAEKDAAKAADKAERAAARADKDAAKAAAKLAAKAAKNAAAPGEIRGLDHVYLPTASFDAGWKFWTEVVGLPAGEVWGEGNDRGGVVPIGKSGLVVAQDAPGKKAEMGYTVELGRPQVFVRVKGLDALCESMKSRGATLVTEPHTTHWGPRGFSVQAPDGLIVSFVE